MDAFELEISWPIDAAGAQRRHQRAKLLVAALALAALLCAAATIWKIAHRDSAIPEWILWFVPLFGYLPAQWILISYRRRKVARAGAAPQVDLARPQTLRFDESGFRGWALEEISVRWEDVNSAHVDRRRASLVYRQRGEPALRSLSVPASALDAAQTARLAALIEQVRPRFAG